MNRRRVGIGCGAALVVLLLCAGVGLVARGGRGSPTATPRPAAAAATPTKNSASTAATAVPANSRDEASAAQLSAYLRENFGTAPAVTTWFPLMTGLTVRGNTVTVTTTAFPDAEGKAAVVGLCGGVSGFIFAPANAAMGLTHVVVTGQGNKTLIDRNGVSDKCE